MAQKIEWSEKTVRISSLQPYEKNPRTITDDQFIKLKASLVKFGQFMPLAATMDSLLIGGHQRIKAMKELGWTECRISIPNRELDKKEYEYILLSLNHNNGMFDMEALANNFEFEFLQSVGLHEVTNIAPMGGDEDNAGRKMMKCPACEHQFPAKGNGVK